MEVTALTPLGNPAVTCCIYCAKIFKDITTLLCMCILKLSCGIFCCEIWMKWEFELLVKYFRYCCVTNYEKRQVLTRIDNKFTNVCSTYDGTSSYKLFMSTLVNYYERECAKCAKTGYHTNLHTKIVHFIEESSKVEERNRQCAEQLFNSLKEKEELQYDSSVVLSIAYSFSCVQNKDWSDIDLLTSLSQLRDDFPIRVVCESILGLINFRRHKEWLWIERLQSNVETKDIYNFTNKESLSNIMNKTIKEMCSIGQCIPDESLRSYLSVMYHLMSFGLAYLNCSTEISIVVGAIRDSGCELEVLNEIGGDIGFYAV